MGFVHLHVVFFDAQSTYTHIMVNTIYTHTINIPCCPCSEWADQSNPCSIIIWYVGLCVYNGWMKSVFMPRCACACTSEVYGSFCVWTATAAQRSMKFKYKTEEFLEACF